MERYDYGYRRGGDYWDGDWSRPTPPEMRGGYRRGRSGDRPWADDVRNGYQGGMGGMPTGGARDDFRGEPEYRARDEWWLGGHQRGRYDETFERAYREFDERNHPHFTPVGGNYHAMGGEFQYRRAPRPLREDMWFSDWTRWF